MNDRAWRGLVLVAWAAFFIWLLASDEVYRYIGPRTQWVVVFGAAALTIGSIAFAFTRGMRRGQVDAWLIAMLVPIVAVVAVPRPTLGSLAASRKMSGGPVVSLQPQPLAPGEEISFAEIEYASQSDEYAAANAITDGVEVELTGFVTATRGAGDFELTRFAIFCCAADVVPHSVPVAADETPTKDTWLTVTGVLEQRDGTFVVRASSVTEVPEPKDPYIR